MAIGNGTKVESAFNVPTGELVQLVVRSGGIGGIVVQALEAIDPAGPVQMWVAPLGPDGEPYADDIQLAVAGGDIELGASPYPTAYLFDLSAAPGSAFVVTFNNGDSIDHTFDVVVLGKD